MIWPFTFVFFLTYVNAGWRLNRGVMGNQAEINRFDCNDSLEGFVLKSVTQHLDGLAGRALIK